MHLCCALPEDKSTSSGWAASSCHGALGLPDELKAGRALALGWPLYRAVPRCKVTAHAAAFPTAASLYSTAPGRIPGARSLRVRNRWDFGVRALAELQRKQLMAGMLVLALEKIMKEVGVLPWSAP